MWKKSEGEASQRPPEAASAVRPGGKARGGGSAVIGASIVVDGDLTGSEDMTIHGRVKGTVRLPDHRLQIGPEGRVEATAHARSIVVDGQVKGDLNAEQEIIVRGTGNVRGNLSAPRIGLEEGARFKGRIDMEPAAAGGGKSGGPATGAQATGEGGDAKSQEKKPDGSASSENKATG